MAAFIVTAVDGGSSYDLVLRAATAADLGRYRGQTRLHSESDLRVYLRWCITRGLDPLATVRADIDHYLRWLQDERRYPPSTGPGSVRRVGLVGRRRCREEVGPTRRAGSCRAS